MHSVALIEDLPLEHAYADPKVFFAAADKAYSQVSSIYMKSNAALKRKQIPKVLIDFSNGPNRVTRPL